MRWIAAILLCGISVIAVGGETKQTLVVDCNKSKDDAQTCTACNIYHEARSEPSMGQLAVALVTQNRANSKRYPSTMCGVVWESRTSKKTGRKVPMFSWTLDGKHDRVYNKQRWDEAMTLAKVVIDDEIEFDFTRGALWYHNKSVSPFWKDAYQHTITIANHHFYVAKDSAESTNDELFATFLQAITGRVKSFAAKVETAMNVDE